MSPDVVHRQALALAGDLQRPLDDWLGRAQAALERACNSVAGLQAADIEAVWLTGCGDSHHAALAARRAFRQLAGVEAVAVEAATLAEGLPLPDIQRRGRRVAVVAVSASGRTSKVAQALAAARSEGLPGLIVSGAAQGPATQAASAALLVDLPGSEPSPGVRTYQASLLGLVLLALALGRRRGTLGDTQVRDWLMQIGHLGLTMSAWQASCRARCDAMAVQLAQAPFVFFAASGLDMGTARHAAAKLVECAGLLGVAREAEEWWHVERFVQAPQAPLVVLVTAAPPAGDVGMELMQRAAAAGRKLVLVAPHSTAGTVPDTLRNVERLDYPDGVPRVLAPLLLGLPCAMLAASTATVLGRRPFLGKD